MQMTIAAKGKNANRISYFLGKNPNNPYVRKTKFGEVQCKFLRYEPEEVIAYYTFLADGLSLVKESDYHHLEDYINDREFSLSSIFLSNIRTSIGYVFSGGIEGIEQSFDFTVSLSPISTRLPDHAIVDLFQPIGYEVEIEKVQSNYDFKVDSGRVVHLTLHVHTNITTLFHQLFILIPVLDNYKHHFIDKQEVDKLLRYGDGWLENHPKKKMITNRFVRYRKSLANEAIHLLEEKKESETFEAEKQQKEPEIKIKLGTLRYSTFDDYIRKLNIKHVVDMGAGEGRLLELFVQNEQLEEIIACEPTTNGIERMKLLVQKLKEKKKVKVEPNILQSSLFYFDERLVGKDAIVLCEVMEHIERDRIDSVFSHVLSLYQPKHFLFSTPNIEYNEVYGLNGKFRHSDHRYEMTRGEFETFAKKHAKEQGYTVEIIGIGEFHETFGFPTQMAILTKNN